MSRTSIEWTEAVWNPLRGCSRISPGCAHCYAERHASRFSGEGLPFHGYAEDGRWTRKVSLLGGSDVLTAPLAWRTHRRVFISMSDPFHEALRDDEIDRVFAVMAICAMRENRPSHTFQILTKRAERLHTYTRAPFPTIRARLARASGRMMEDGDGWHDLLLDRMPWPLPNVWLGVSVEDQEYAELRIPQLLMARAAVRFVSYEPALGPVDFSPFLRRGMCTRDGPRAHWETCDDPEHVYPRLDWGIVGGESGAGARPFDVAWGWSFVQQFQAAGVPCFFKQMGDHPVYDGAPLDFAKKKGGDPSEWPAALRVREYPSLLEAHG